MIYAVMGNLFVFLGRELHGRPPHVAVLVSLFSHAY